jgi:TRAP-type C4-dicarboxylate transport system permease small subunit
MTVILRYFFNTGIAWAEEVPRLLVGYFAFFACAMGVRDREHMSMDFMYELFPKNGKIRAAIDFFADFCVLACGLFMFYYGGMRVLKMMTLTGCLPITQWPNWVRYAAVPIAGFVIVFDCILFLTKVIKPGDTLFTKPEEEQVPPLAEGEKEVGE